MKKLIIVIVVVLLVAGAWYLWGSGEPEAEAEVQEPVMQEVERGPIVLIVSTTGRVVANLDVDIKCKASGEVVKLPFDVSDIVKKGDLLVEVDPVYEERNVKRAKISLSSLEARLAQAKQNLEIATLNLDTERKRAQAALESSKARHEDAKSKLERMKQLLEKKLASQEEYDTVETSSVQAQADLSAAQIRIEEIATQEKSLDLKRQDVKLAESQVESDRIALSIVQQNLTDTKVYAPIDGVVSVRNVQTGQIISSGISNVGGGTTVLTLSDLSRLFILASVDESDIGRVRVGQPAKITADAYPEERFGGRVVRIATKGISTSNVVTFEVKIEVTSPNKNLLKPEMTANIDIIAEKDDNALLIPVEAVTRMNGKKFVTVAGSDGKTEEREIETGISDGLSYSVTSGLGEGDIVLIQQGGASKWQSEEWKKRMKQRAPMMMFGGRRGRK